LEESYEVMEAVDQRDSAGLAEELGDLLLQVLFYAQIANEAGQFSIDRVVESVREKLVRRHPHVFGDTQVIDSLEVQVNWEYLKKQERGGNDETSILGHLPIDMPALAYGQLIQDRASYSGFDWDAMDGVLDKVTEEVCEINEAGSQEAKVHEFGDLLFTLVNVGRWLGIQTEDALRQANARFYGRFVQMERLARERGISFADQPLVEKERLWDEAKGQKSA